MAFNELKMTEKYMLIVYTRYRYIGVWGGAKWVGKSKEGRKAGQAERVLGLRYLSPIIHTAIRTGSGGKTA